MIYGEEGPLHTAQIPDVHHVHVLAAKLRQLFGLLGNRDQERVDAVPRIRLYPGNNNIPGACFSKLLNLS